MRRLALLSALAAAHLCAFAQEKALPSPMQLDAQSVSALNELRIDRATENVKTLPLADSLRKQLSETRDLQLMLRVLSKQSALGVDELSKDVKARVFLRAIVTEAQDATVRNYLQHRGLQPDQMLMEAREGGAPIALADTVRSRLVIGKAGVSVLGRADVLITKGERLYPGTVKPGQPVNAPGPQPTVWPAGLTYAGALGKKAGTEFNVQCTGTVITRTWFLTAAHCLLDEATGRRFVNAELSVFLPYQQGKESFIGFSGRPNKNMRRIAVVDSTWLGGEAGEPFPKTADGFSHLIRSGKDVALLKLDAGQVAALPNRIPEVKLYASTPSLPPVTMIGFGVGDKVYLEDSDLAVGVRTSVPPEFAAGRPLFSYGPSVAQGGICGGDSGGGMFAGKVTGQESVIYIVSINSGLVGDVRNDANLCIASEQLHTSMMASSAKTFLCKHAPDACTGPQ